MFRTFTIRKSITLTVSLSAACILTLLTTLHFSLLSHPAPPHPSLPPPLSRVYPLSRHSPVSPSLLSHPYTSPHLLAAYAHLPNASSPHALLTLFTTGISLGSYGRNFTISACIINDHIFPTFFFRSDVARCHVPSHVLLPSAHITAALALDPYLKRAMKGPVTLSLGMRAELLPTDVSPVPSHYILHSDAPVHENMRLVPSHVKLKGGVETLPGGARYEFCLATQIKPAVYMLPDWLDYHRRIGIDMVYIFDNGASEDLNGMFANRTDVEVLFWPFARSQLQAFSYAMISLRTRCEWVLLLDSDEYLMLGLDTDTVSDKVIGFRPLKKHVGDLRDAGFQRVSFNWLVMKNSDFVNRPPVPAPLAYVHREEPQVARLWKTMASTDVNWTGSTPHTRVTDELVRTYSKKWVSMTPTDVADVGIVVHFRKRSWEEYSEKVLAGRGNIQNPRSLESIQKMRELGKDRNQERYMRLGLKNRAEYTFFRSVWKRVKKGFSNSEVVVARWRRDGVRCRALFNVGEGGVGDTRFIAETCSPPRSTPSE